MLYLFLIMIIVAVTVVVIMLQTKTSTISTSQTSNIPSQQSHPERKYVESVKTLAELSNQESFKVNKYFSFQKSFFMLY